MKSAPLFAALALFMNCAPIPCRAPALEELRRSAHAEKKCETPEGCLFRFRIKDGEPRVIGIILPFGTIPLSSHRVSEAELKKWRMLSHAALSLEADDRSFSLLIEAGSAMTLREYGVLKAEMEHRCPEALDTALLAALGQNILERTFRSLGIYERIRAKMNESPPIFEH